MTKPMNTVDGLRRLVNRHRKQFRIPENLNYYSAEDFLAAERKFLKFSLLNGKVVHVELDDEAGSPGRP